MKQLFATLEVFVDFFHILGKNVEVLETVKLSDIVVNGDREVLLGYKVL